MEEKDGHTFHYSYSAPTEREKREINAIRRFYEAETGKAEKLERLRALDKKVRFPATAIALTFGVIGTLVFGAGLALVLEGGLFARGIAVSLAGGVLLALAYPVHAAILKRNKKKYGKEILRLAEELAKEPSSRE